MTCSFVSFVSFLSFLSFVAFVAFVSWYVDKERKEQAFHRSLLPLTLDRGRRRSTLADLKAQVPLP
jgi:hypothetical protein